MTKPEHAASSSQGSDAWELTRRDAALGLLGVAALAGASRAGAADNVATAVAPPALEFVFELTARLGPPLDLGASEGITHRQIPVLDGTASGPKFRGKVLPGGNDTQRIHENGRTEILARYLLQADDGGIVQVTNPGVRLAPPEVMKRLAAGELVDPKLYYFRTTPSFVTTAKAHAWLEESVFVCVGVRRPDTVSLRYYAVL
jgi:hypothetical protein